MIYIHNIKQKYDFDNKLLHLRDMYKNFCD